MNRKLATPLLAVFLALVPLLAWSQGNPRPYRLSAGGGKISIQCSKPIRNLMVWTAGGHRVLEQRNLNTTSYQLAPPVNEKYFFVMIQTTDGKVYTDKIGTGG